MAENDDTLSLPPADPLLPGFSGADLGSELLEDEASQRARYSGKIVERNQARVQSIVGARAMGFGVRQVCGAFRVSPHTLAEIERRHGSKLATLKERVARKFGVFVELGIDRAIREVDTMDIDKLMISLGIGTEKMLLLTGDPTSIVGTGGEGPKTFSLDTLNARLGRRERDIIDVTPTGSDGAKDGATREAPPAAPALDQSKPAASDAASES